MKFFQERKKKKQLSEFKARRHAEDDLLSAALRQRFDEVIAELADAPLENLDAALTKAQKDYAALPLPRRGKLYGFLDLVAVVGAVAFGLRGLFFQPFQIPTGSMQPTLYGMHYQQIENNANAGFSAVPGGLHNVIYGTVAAKAVHRGREEMFTDAGIVSDNSGMIFEYSAAVLGNSRYRLPGNERQVADYLNIKPGDTVRDGDVIADGHMTLGDHLFVERVSMYLSPPERGDVIVFNTEGLAASTLYGDLLLEQTGGYYYIKRLAALPGDTVKIVDDQLWVRPAGAEKFCKIQELAPQFEKVYSMRGGYHGHTELPEVDKYGNICQPFAYGKEYLIPEDYYLMLGDNSNFSMDSRYFGAVPRKNLIGRAWLVFYPFSRRWGIADRNEPLDVPTGKAGKAVFPSMSLQ